MKTKMIYRAGSILLFLFLWLVLIEVINNPLLMPSIQSVFSSIISILTSMSQIQVILMTMLRLFIAILVSLIAGVLLGILSGIIPQVSWLLKPHVTVLRTIPVISIIVILLVLFGFRIAPYIITFLMVFPIIYQAAYEGIRHMDSELKDVYRLEAHDIKLAIKYLYVPLITPYVTLSILQSFGLGLKVLVMAEYLSQTRNSIGNALYLSKVNLAYDAVFGWSILLILMSLGFEYVFRTYQNRKS
jgi:NitT/TauT family transport system permease protein